MDEQGAAAVNAREAKAELRWDLRDTPPRFWHSSSRSSLRTFDSSFSLSRSEASRFVFAMFNCICSSNVVLTSLLSLSSFSLSKSINNFWMLASDACSRHVGQLLELRIHASMHDLWKQWPHRVAAISSVGSAWIKQIEHFMVRIKKKLIDACKKTER